MSRASPLKSADLTIRIEPRDWKAVIARLGIADADAERSGLEKRLLFGLRILSAPIPSKRQQVAFIRKVRAARQAEWELFSTANEYDVGLLSQFGYPPELLNQKLHSRALVACVEADKHLSKPAGKRRDSIPRGWREGIRKISYVLHDNYRGSDHTEKGRDTAVCECILTLVLKSGAIGKDEKTHETFREQLAKHLQTSKGFGQGPGAHARAIESIASALKRKRDKQRARGGEPTSSVQKDSAWQSITDASPETIEMARVIAEEHGRKQEKAPRGRESDPIFAEPLPLP
jgi:hypothetical protein